MLASAGGSYSGPAVSGEHADLDIRTKLAYLVETGGHKLLIAADSRNIEPKLYEHLHQGDRRPSMYCF